MISLTPPRATVLLVEDETMVRMLGCDVLEEAGFEVIEAANADEALAVLRQGTGVDVLFTDVEMPGSLDGYGLARLAHERWPQVKVLIVSGRRHPGPGDLPPGGAFIGKPYSPGEVVRRVREMAGDAG